MNKKDLDLVNQFKSEIKDLYDETTKSVNSVTTETYNKFNEVTTEMSKVVNKVTVLGDMLTDLRVLNGTAKTIHYLSSLDVVENRGIKLVNDKFTLDTLNTSNREINSSRSSIASLESYKLLTTNNKPAYLEDFIKTGSEVKVIFENPYTFTLNLMYDTPQQINSIDLQLGLQTQSYPIIMSIKYLDSYNTINEAVILDNNSRSINLDEERVQDNLYTINITPVITDQLFIELSSRDFSEITLKNIKTYYRTPVEEGYIILGPIHSEDSILKIAIDSENISDGVSFEVSSDLEYWLPIVNSSSTAGNGDKKILSFNTVNIDSIKTTEDLFSFYIKISLSSSEITNDNIDIELYKTYREDNAISNDTLSIVNNNLFSAYRVKNSDFIYGDYIYTNTLNPSRISLDRLEYIENDGVLKVLGTIDTKYSITNTNNSARVTGSIGAELKVKRLTANKVIDATKFDIAGSIVYDIYPRYIEETINSKQKENICLLLKNENSKEQISEDTYTIIGKDSKKSIQIDLSTPFVENSIATIINVGFEDIIIKNSIGKIIKEVDKNSLLTITDNDGIFYFLNLVDILFDPIIVEGFTYSKLYPLKELNDLEYGLVKGKIVTGSDVILNIKGYELLKTVVDINKVVNYTNGNYIKRLDDDFTYHNEQIIDTDTINTIIKLNNVSIERGSLKLEEYFGEGESYTSTPTDTRRYLNVGTTDSPNYVIVDADNTNEFLQE